jgi:hypothetical protein
MPKSPKSNQQSKTSAKHAESAPVSKSLRNEMTLKILALHDKHGLHYDEISEGMGRPKGGYSKLIASGGRCAPTMEDYRGVNGMWAIVTLRVDRTHNETARKIKINGLLAEAMRLNSEG